MRRLQDSGVITGTTGMSILSWQARGVRAIVRMHCYGPTCVLRDPAVHSWPEVQTMTAGKYDIMDSMNGHYYRDARLIEEQLSEAGHPDWALQIDDAIEDGSSASEILVRLRGALTQIWEQHLGLPAHLEDEIEALLRALG